MSGRAGGWAATVTLRRPDRTAADRLVEVLAPEAAREVPGATAAIERPDATCVRLKIRTEATGTLRAALNAYLGWVELAVRSEEVARSALAGPPTSPIDR